EANRNLQLTIGPCVGIFAGRYLVCYSLDEHHRRVARRVTMFRRLIGPLFITGFAAAILAQQPAPQNPPVQNMVVWVPHSVVPEKIDADMNTRIKTEGIEHSKLMWIEHELTDVYGPRPIGSPNHKAAADWAVKTMTSFGMKNGHLEPFTWRGVG